MYMYNYYNKIKLIIQYELNYLMKYVDFCRQFESSNDPIRLRYGTNSVMNNRHDNFNSEDINSKNNGSYDIMQRNHIARQYVRNDSRGLTNNFNTSNTSSNQVIIESIRGPQTVSKMLQNNDKLSSDFNQRNSNMQNIEMIPFSNSTHHEDIESYMLHANLSKSQELQRVSQYIQSLPDFPIYDSTNEFQTFQDQEPIFFANEIQESISETKATSESASSPIPPPPPAPPDPPQEIMQKSSPTTGERIFNALRSVTSQSYIDASEFYK